ncbi:iron complex outermembrane receptor protein [Flavobacterium sp. HSC-32F16]|uniref:TonB-dependent receptor n=1 Tax=Flavobacterium sp. HSC-32F16 TaxID=2910964 RepID=UPI0020A55E12|nr:TonB-dependent receptor [Flavobacterium sp. HSC-32F16]MCP2028246.1 iron complex outermembrane receptor protein [Flavobacterium sp. HSC-32F16]
MKVKILFPFLSFCLMLLTSVTSFAQTATIRGMISLSTNEAADNVSVTLKGTRVGTTTDAQGNYEIKNVKPGTYTIKVSAVGFSSKEKSITVSSANEIVENFTLITTSENLTEVFVKGNANKYTKSESEYVSRMQVKNLENSQVYNVVTKELMKDQLVINQDEALKNVPGLYQLWGATNRAGDGGSWYSLRGFTTQSLVRNGIAGKVNSNSDAANLERIEVIKGPSATLFGNVLSSYGGLINRVTKKPYETFGGEIAYQAGSYGFNRVSADVNTPLNDDNTALFRLNTSYTNNNTFQDYGSSRSFFVAPSFSYKVNDKLTLSLDAEIGDQNNSGMPLIYLPFDVSVTALGFNNAKDLNMNFKRSFWGDEFITNTKTFNVFAQANYKISDEWTSQSVFSSTSNKASGLQTWFYLYPNEIISRNAWNANGKDNAIEFQQNFNGDFLLFGKMRNRFLIGGDLFHSTNRLGYRLLPNGELDRIGYTGAAPTYNNFNPTTVNAELVNGFDYKTNSALSTYSAYVADAVNITESLIVSAAVRFDHYDNQGTTDDTTGQRAGDFSQNAFSPKFGVVYQVIKDQVSVFGNYQNSFTNIGYINANVGGALQLQKFDPERANQFEGGIKVNAFQNKVSATLSYYDIKVKDIVTADPSLPNSSIQNGTQYSKGFELEVTANPIPGLNLLVGYSNNDSKLNGLRPVTAGPENLINYWISYNLQNAAFKGLGLGFGGNYGDATYIYNNGTETFELPSYAVLNAALYYDQPKYRVSLKVNNLTDELYFNGYTTINVQAPRTFMGSVTYKF